MAELTGLLPAGTLADYPPGTRILIRRERPHPGAQLDAFEERDGWRYQCIATDTAAGQLAFLDARHRAHARVEDRIRCGKDTGLGRFPSRTFAINAAWLTAVMLAVDLLAWTQTILLHDQPAAGQSRTEDAALPAPARRRPPRPRRPPAPAPPRPALALGHPPRRRLHPLRRPAPTRPLNHHPDPTTGAGEPGEPRPGNQPRPPPTTTTNKIHNRHRRSLVNDRG